MSLAKNLGGRVGVSNFFFIKGGVPFWGEILLQIFFCQKRKLKKNGKGNYVSNKLFFTNKIVILKFY